MAMLQRMQLVSSVFFFVTSLISAASLAADWPTWRGDAARHATTEEALPTELARHWTIQLPPNAPAWPEDPRLQFDACYEPVVVGNRLFVASAVNDSVTAYDVTDGKELWRVFAGGPVRFAPVIANEKVYFGADDGVLTCVSAADGKLVWRHNAAPNGRMVIGSERLVSVWPVRGGPVLEGGKLFAAIGVWPFEGTFLVAVDAETGTPTSVANAGSAEPVLLKERTPQGYLVATKDRLFIPCGRSAVAVFDRETGEFVPHTYKTSEVTTFHAAATDRWLFHGALAYDMESKTSATPAAKLAVLDPSTAFVGDKNTVQALDLADPEVIIGKDRTGKETRRIALKPNWTWKWDNTPVEKPAPLKKGEKPVVVPVVRVHLRAARQLFAQRESTIFSLNLADDAKAAPAIGWKADLQGTPASMVAAAGRLFVVTAEGAIHCFGAKDAAVAKVAARVESTKLKADASGESSKTKSAQRVEDLLAQTGIVEGYAVVLNDNPFDVTPDPFDGLVALASKSNLRILYVDDDPAVVARLRSRLDRMGLYGSRVSVLQGDLNTFKLPPYLASLTVGTSDLNPLPRGGILSISDDPEWFRILRPYGGTAVSAARDGHAEAAKAVAQGKYPGLEISRKGNWTLLTRAGPLPGSANWTHEYGDPANTLMLRDELVKAPLGVLWFGGPAASGELFYNRHFWGPSMAVIDGRMLVQGPKKLSAIDVYTGRVLWKQPLEYDDRNNPGRRGEDFENMLAGYNFVAVPDAIYVVQGPDLLTLDPKTGKETARWQLPKADLWGTIRVQGDIVVAEAFPAEGEFAGKAKRLVAVDRRSGKTLWSREANLSFPVTAVGPDLVYCFDADIENFYFDWKRKGLVPKANEIRVLKAFDLRTGKPAWERSTDKVITWLAYAAEQDILVASNREHIAGQRGKDGEELWKKDAEGVGFKGHPESLWDKLILWKGQILDQRGPGLSYDVKTGEAIRQVHPVTGEPVDWEFTKSGHHCNYAIASPHLMTFRADTAGFCDIESGNTARLDGFRSGCRNSLIPANGVLNSPNFAHGCVCGYSLFTSLALVHVPENELWGYNALKAGDKPVRRIGINLGGRGDRMSAQGTFWVEYPNVTGTLLGTTVKIEGADLKWFQRHSSFVQGTAESLPWVAGCGVEGATAVTVRWEPEGKEKTARYRVRLYFAEPDSQVKPGDRVFGVQVQGKSAAEHLDVAEAAGGSLRALVKQMEVEATGELRIDLVAGKGRPILSGVEIEAIGPL